MARTPSGLTDEQVTELRTALQANKRPKVTVAGQQFGGETTGQVVTVGDPETEGPEFVQVRVTLDGLTDVLRFAPKELRVPQRGRAANAAAPAAARAPRRVAAVKPAAAKPPAPEPAAAKPPAPEPAAEKSSAPDSAAATPATARNGSTVPKPASAPKSAAGAKPVPAAPSTARSGGERSARKGVVRPPTVTITITSSGTDWTVTANRGGKSVLKAAPLAPGVVAAAVELLGEQQLSTAVEQVNGAALSLAQQRAEELRAELAAVESLLAAHRTPVHRASGG